MNNGNIAGATIRIDADTSQAITNLRRVSHELNSLVPGGNAVASVFERVQGGFLQLIQGLSRNAFQSLSMSMSKMVSSGINVAKTIEMSRVAFDNLLESGEDVDQLLLKIQEDAVKTPFDVDALTLSTQKIALITKNGAIAERTILSLGKALAAAGRGTAEMNRMATNLQQIGQNAKATERDLREFGNAGVDIVGIVTEFSDEFKASGLAVTEARDWLKSIDKPFEVIVNALNNAGDAVEGFANIYEGGAQTIGQAMENMSDSVGIFSYRVMQQASVLDRAKNVMKEFQDGLFLNKEFTANAAQAIAHLLQTINELHIVQPIIEGIKKAMSAFAAGQFDNIIVFFQNLWRAIKQFSGFKAIANAFKVFADLFSDNHTAEEVAKVAQQIGNLIRVVMELKMMNRVSEYAYNLSRSVTTTIYSLQTLTQWMFTAGSASATFGKGLLGAAGVIGTVIAAIALFSNISGKNIVDVFESIISGIKNFFEFIGNAAKNMVTFGWNLIVGLYNGIVEGFNAVIGKIKEIAQNIINAFAQVFQIHSPSKVMKDYIGRNIVEGIAEGILENYGTAVVAMEEVMEELVKLQAEYVKELGDFGALDLVQQVQVYKMFADLYQRGTRARLEADAKVHDAETAIVKEMIDLIEDFNKAFDKAFKKAKDYYDMFEYTQVTLTRTTKSVIEGLRRQNDNMSKYYQNIYKMSQMGFDDDFMAYVYEQGMDAASEVAGLADATAEQIEEINEMWRTRGKIATDIAVLNTKKLKEETIEELDYLQTGLDTKALDYYDSGTYLLYNFARGIYDMMPTLEDAMAQVSATTSKGSKAAADATQDLDTALGEAALDNAEEFTAAAHRMNIELFDTNDIFSLMKNVLSGMPWWVWAGAGLKAVTGVTKGIMDFKKNLGGAQTAARSVGDAFAGTFKRVTTETQNFAGATDKATAIFKKGAKTTSATFEKMSDDINGTYTKTVTETRRAAKQVNDITYSSATKQGENLLRPFKTFNTRVKGFFSTISNTINEMLNVVFSVIKNFVRQVMGVIAEFTGGIGKAIKALLKPLSDPKLLIGVGVLAALAVTLMLVAKAGQMFAAVRWESMAKMAISIGAIVAVAAVMGALGTVSKQIMLGALAVAAAGAAIGVAAAAIGLGLQTLASGLAQADQIGTQIQGQGLAAILASIVVVSAIMAVIAPLSILGAISGLFASVLSVEMLIIAASLATVSALGQNINLEGINKVLDAVAIVALLMVPLGLVSALAAVVGVAATILSVEMLIIATSLAGASQMGKFIDLAGVGFIAAALAIVSVALTLLTPFAVIGAIAGIAASVLSVEFLIIAAALAGGSQLGKSIDLDGIDRTITAIATVSEGLTALTFFSIIGAIAGLAASILSVEYLIIAAALAGGSQLGKSIDMDGVDRTVSAIAAVSEGMTALLPFTIIGAVSGLAAAILSGEFLIIAASLAKGSELGKNISTEGIDSVVTAVATVSESLSVLTIFTTIGAVSGLAAAILANEFLVIADSLAKASMMGKLIVAEDIEKIQEAIGVVAEAMTKMTLIAGLGSISGAFASILANEFLSIAQSLGTACLYAKAIIPSSLARITAAIEILKQIDFGGLFENLGKAVVAEELAIIANNIEEIIRHIHNCIEQLMSLDAVQEGAVDKYVAKTIYITERLADLTLGDYNTAKNNAKATEKLKEISEDISTIISSISGAVEQLAELDSSVGNKVEGYVDQAKKIVEQLAQLVITDNKDGLFGSTDLEKTRDAASRIATTTGYVKDVINSVKEMVDVLAAFTKQGLSATQVSEYVENAKSIVDQFSKLSPSNEVTEEVKENVGRISEVSQNVATILDSAKKVVESIQYFTKEEVGGVDKVKEMVAQANDIVAEFGKLALPTEVEGAYETLAKNTTDLSTAVKSVAEILENGKKMLELVEQYDQYVQGKDVELMVQHINKMLAVIAGGEAYSDGKMDWHKGITMPEGTTFQESDASMLEAVKKAVEQIKGIAELIQQVPDVADKLSGVNQIVEFIKETMSQIPQAVGSYAEEMKMEGEAYANYFIAGWRSKFPELEKVGAEAQGELWRALEDKMRDEFEQGRWMAKQVADGFSEGARNYGPEAGHKMQSEIWHSIQNRFPDEYKQGQALANEFVNGIWAQQSSWWWTGDNMVAGVAGGINRNMWQISQAAGNISDTAIWKLRQLLDIHSPSKVMAEIGGYVAEGFADGINDSLSEVEEAGEALANAVMDGYNGAIEPIDLTAYEARAMADQAAINGGYSNRTTNVVQNNNIYNNMDVSQALSQIAWEVSRS